MNMTTKKSHQQYLHRVRQNSPLVLCLTNTVTVTDCANGLLAVGASPVMSEDPSDAAALAAMASSVVVNIGTINDRQEPVMEAAAKAARDRGLPLVLDPVGAGASRRRLEAARKFLEAATIVRGNASEILALAGDEGLQKGVDSSSAMSDELLAEAAAGLARARGVVVAVSGRVDLVTDGGQLAVIPGGTPLLTKLTGTGCLLSVIVGAYAGCFPKDQLRATAAAHMHLARAAENAQEDLARPLALGTFKTRLFDELALLEGSDLDSPKGTGQWRMDA
ncbi:MAG: hydroxyethylthiazole kinase [Deltaproteobacteria bacterium]|jgi:hydroxyethylthiazole kinase|nr:hydroxyethylthiazole kinase [Deltaproteobacteria bacterium]